MFKISKTGILASALALALSACSAFQPRDPQAPTSDEEQRIIAAASVGAIAACTVLKDSIKPAERAQVVAAMRIVQSVVRGAGSPPLLENDLRALFGSQQRYVPLIAAAIYTTSIYIPPDFKTTLFVTVVNTATQLCADTLGTDGGVA